MFYQYDDLSVDEAGDIVAERHIHHLFETERLELDRYVEVSPVERVVESEEVRLCIFIFAEEIDEDRILIPTILLCHKNLREMSAIYIAEMLRFRSFLKRFSAKSNTAGQNESETTVRAMYTRKRSVGSNYQVYPTNSRYIAALEKKCKVRGY